MLGPQDRITQSKRIENLQDRVKRLTAEVAYVAEMNRLSSQMVHSTGKMLALMDENKTADVQFSDRLAEMNGALHAKVQQCDTWLRENTPKLERLTAQLTDRT